MVRRYALRDDQWERIKDMLPGQEGQAGATAKDNRLFVDAVLYRCIDTAQAYPGEICLSGLVIFESCIFGTRWSKNGVWERIFKELAQEADNEYAMIDSTIVRAHQHSAGAKKGGLKNPKAKPLDAAAGD